MELAESSSIAQEADLLSTALRWRDTSESREIVVRFVVRDESALPALARLVEHLAAKASPYRDWPTVRVYCRVPLGQPGLARRLADMDVRTPRLEVIRVCDAPVDPYFLESFAEETATAEVLQLQLWPYLEVQSTSMFGRLDELLSRHDASSVMDSSEIYPLFRRFPTIEVPGAFSLEDAAPTAALWSSHPQLQAASDRSLGGRVSTFFRRFEVARLARLGLDLPQLQCGNSDEQRQLLALDAWLINQGYLEREPRLESSVLAHDVDLLADSHECQSPVFAFAGVVTSPPATRE